MIAGDSGMKIPEMPEMPEGGNGWERAGECGREVCGNCVCVCGNWVGDVYRKTREGIWEVWDTDTAWRESET